MRSDVKENTKEEKKIVDGFELVTVSMQLQPLSMCNSFRL